MGQLLPTTQAVHAFSYSVLFDGQQVGDLQSFAPSSNKTLTRVRALAQGNGGETIEIVPSITDHQITITALELYRKQVIEFMGYTNFASIEDLKTPIDIREIITAPDGTQSVIDYQECWHQSYNKSGITAGGNVVTDNIVFWVTRIRVGS